MAITAIPILQQSTLASEASGSIRPGWQVSTIHSTNSGVVSRVDFEPALGWAVIVKWGDHAPDEYVVFTLEEPIKIEDEWLIRAAGRDLYFRPPPPLICKC